MVPDLQSDAEMADNNVVADMDGFVEMDINEADDCVVVDMDGWAKRMFYQDSVVVDKAIADGQVGQVLAGPTFIASYYGLF